jgi:hypothetical protein
VAFLSATCYLQPIFLDPSACIVFYPLFQGSFWGPSGIQNGLFVVPSESLRSLLSNDIKFAQIGALSEKLWLLQIGVSELFFYIFLAKIPAKQEMLPANRELHIVAGVALFCKVPNLWINL